MALLYEEQSIKHIRNWRRGSSKMLAAVYKGRGVTRHVHVGTNTILFYVLAARLSYGVLFSPETMIFLELNHCLSP